MSYHQLIADLLDMGGDALGIGSGKSIDLPDYLSPDLAAEIVLKMWEVSENSDPESEPTGDPDEACDVDAACVMYALAALTREAEEPDPVRVPGPKGKC